MKLYLQREKSGIDAIGTFNIENKEFKVLKGSKISETVNHSNKFRGAKSVEKARINIVINNILTSDITFKSASTAANFVTGASSNGLIAWKNKEGKCLKEILQEESTNE